MANFIRHGPAGNMRGTRATFPNDDRFVSEGTRIHIVSLGHSLSGVSYRRCDRCVIVMHIQGDSTLASQRYFIII